MIITALIVAASATALPVCSGPDRAARQVTCIVDGDTGWEHGVKWRLLGVDTPEYPPYAKCDAERDAAVAATYRAIELMEPGYEIIWSGKKGELKRDLVRVRLADGRMLGDVLLEEGHAKRWPNDGNPWCDPQ